MKARKPILHARDHLPGGADPLPGLGEGGVVDPPREGLVDDAAGVYWHWWRFREAAFRSPTDEYGSGRGIRDDGNAPGWGYPLTVNTYHPSDFDEEFVLGTPGPNPDARSMRRTGLQAFGTVNWWDASGAIPDPAWGIGSKWTLAGWFKFDALGSHDIFTIQGTGSPTFATNATYLLLQGDGGVKLHRQGTEFTGGAGKVRAGEWVYVAIVCGGGRIRVYVNPGPAEPADYNPAIGGDFPFAGPMAMDTWGLANGNYTAAELAQRLKDNGFKTAVVQLNAEYSGGHAAYITKLAADVATLQAAGIQVVGWGEVDGTTGADLAATGVTGWMPQIEGPSQYDNVIAALGAGVGAGLPKAVVTTYGGLDTPAKVAALIAAGIDAAAVEVYAEIGDYPYSNVDVMLGAGVNYGFDPAKLIPMLGTYRGETSADYTGFDEDVIPNYGIYNVPQTTDAAWADFASINGGVLMLSGAVIDEPDPAAAASVGTLTVAGPNQPQDPWGSDGSFVGHVSEVTLHRHAVSDSAVRDAFVAGKYPDGNVPPNETIPNNSIRPEQIQPGADGDHLVTEGGVAKWAEDTGGGGGGATELDDLTDVDTTGAAEGEVLTYDAGTSKWLSEPVPPPSVPPIDLGDLTDVDTSGAAEGEVLTYDGGTSTWLSEAPSTPALELDDLTDVATAGVTDGDALVYDAGTSAWGPAAAAAALDLVYHGEYVPATEYVDGDIVVYDNILWLCVRPTSDPPSGWVVP